GGQAHQGWSRHRSKLVTRRHAIPLLTLPTRTCRRRCPGTPCTDGLSKQQGVATAQDTRDTEERVAIVLFVRSAKYLVRYAAGGGLTQAGRRRREQVRQQAADLFTAGVSAIEVAAQLEASTKSAYAWRRAWKAGGSEALKSKGTSGARSKLSDDQMRRL